MSHAPLILSALAVSATQQTALLELHPDAAERDAIVAQCVNLVGSMEARFEAVQAMLAIAVAGGQYDARSRVFLGEVAEVFGVGCRAVAAVELAIAEELLAVKKEEEEEKEGDPARVSVENGLRTVDEALMERRRKKKNATKLAKITGITLVGGVIFGLTGGLIAPALLTALAGVGVTSAAGLAASGTVASASVVGGLFGVAGAGFTVKKARNRVSTTLEEFDFERPEDERVIEGRKKKAERERKKMEKLVAQRLREEAEMNGTLAIEEGEEKGKASPSDIDIEKELPKPGGGTDEDDEDEYDEEVGEKKYKPFTGKKKKKKREKLKVGPKGLEAASRVPSLHVSICVPGWLTERSFGAALDQFEPALKLELPCSQHIALRWESRRLFEMGLAFAKFWASKATVTTLQQTYPHAVAAASTVAGAVAFAFAMPLTVMSCMDYVDNPWSLLVSRSNGAGEELADVLVERSYGNRPVTLFGYSIGARVVFKCLESLASRGAYGIVDHVFLMGAAVTADPERWKQVQQVVAGRIVNAYGGYDWALAFFHRGCGHGVYVSGLRPIELDGVENLNMGYLGIEGHRELKDCVPRVMRAMGVGLGYIIMPPAKLVKGKGRSKADGADIKVCEDPQRISKLEDAGDTSEIAIDVDDVNRRSLATIEDKDERLSREQGMSVAEMNEIRHVDVQLADPTHLREDGLDTLPAPGKSTMKEIGDKKTRTKKKKKAKSWLSWNSWGASNNKTQEKPKSQNPRATDGDASVEVGEEPLDVPYIDSESMFSTSDDAQVEQNSTASADSKDSVEEQTNDNVASHDVEIFSESVAVTEQESVEEFDWEKQRRIWAEQERQIEERGYADSAAEIEMRSKVILGIGIEVAGRAIVPFISQDADLPVAKKEEVFTNCLEVQCGVVVRVYEHEKRTKWVSINMLKHDEQYPKLLGELQLKFRKPAVKGKLRIVVEMWATETGNVCVEMKERFVDGTIGEKRELIIEREHLCTFAERRRLEAAERKRMEAQLQKEMRNRAQASLPALPAAEDKENREKEDVEKNDGDGKGTVIDS